MTEKMTGGPWWVEKPYQVWGETELADGTREQVQIAATVFPGIDSPPYSEARANAIAIAALPDLVEFVGWLLTDGDTRRHLEARPELLERAEIMRGLVEGTYEPRQTVLGGEFNDRA